MTNERVPVNGNRKIHAGAGEPYKSGQTFSFSMLITDQGHVSISTPYYRSNVTIRRTYGRESLGHAPHMNGRGTFPAIVTAAFQLLMTTYRISLSPSAVFA